MSASTLFVGERRHVGFAVNTTKLAANTAIDIVAPYTGYIKEVLVAVEAAVTTGGTIGVSVSPAGVAASPTVVEAAATGKTDVPNGATKGSTYKVFVAKEGSTTRKVNAGDRIRLVLASFATAGELNGVVVIDTADRSAQAAL
jgi:pyruvate/2-oxoglutarate dehydrogenase complex dihydrolipoamide acyltransferase (E2) component